VGYFIGSALVLIVCAAGYVAGGRQGSGGGPSDVVYAKWLRQGSVVFAVAFFVLFTAYRSFHTVSAGHVGVVYQFGGIVGQTDSGFVTVAPWQNVKPANVQVQRYTFDKLDSFSQETQNVFLSATLNYQVNPKDIQQLYRSVGPDYFSKLVPNRVNQFFKDETVNFAATEIAPNRDLIRAHVLKRLKTELAPFSIQVDDLLIDDISFSPEFTSAIEDKQIATQEAKAAQNRVAKAEAEAQQRVAAAEGDAKATIARAKGAAEANRLKRATLTPLLVQQNAIDKLDPNVQVILLPSNSNLLLPGSILGGTVAKP